MRAERPLKDLEIPAHSFEGPLENMEAQQEGSRPPAVLSLQEMESDFHKKKHPNSSTTEPPPDTSDWCRLSRPPPAMVSLELLACHPLDRTLGSTSQTLACHTLDRSLGPTSRTLACHKLNKGLTPLPYHSRT